jgi:hypothetical protein
MDVGVARIDLAREIDLGSTEAGFVLQEHVGGRIRKLPNRRVKSLRRHSMRAALLLLFVLAAPHLVAATFSADSVKAAYLYRFASYIEWPADTSFSGPFIIAVAGADGVAEQLDAMLPRMTVRGRPVEVRRISQTKELRGVQVLFVGAKALSRTRALRRAALDEPILIVTDDPRGLDAGGVINFVESNRNVRFEISLIAADRAQLRIDSALLAVAARVERRPQTRSDCRRAACGSTYLARLAP